MTAITQQYDTGIKLQAIQREISFRERVYPRFIEAGKMTAAFAAIQISIFKAIAEDYQKQAKREQLPL